MTDPGPRTVLTVAALVIVALVVLALAACSPPTATSTPNPTSSTAPAPGKPPVTTPPASAGTGLAMPDPALTPGAVLTTDTAAVCTPGWAGAHRDVPAAEHTAVFVEYHVPPAQRDGAHYEIDHLIPLELGGSNAIENLWAEPQTENDQTGPDKDALEAHLHALVCDHQLALTDAQHAIATDWVAAWNRYEHVPTDPGNR